ncbi:hypothetical protein [Paenibacillus sp. FSL M7-0420]|uniref:hypothetical protein n=1 Tax=Paenibacillus sp. FSL M7-0420 TaxID=2921609 RepID=UPI0030FD19A6
MRNTSFCPTIGLLGLNLIHDHVQTTALHAIDTPRGVIQEIRDVAQVTFALGRLLGLGNILSFGTQNDAMDEGEQMTQLRLEEFQFQSQNELDDGQVEGYHDCGTFILEIWRGNQNFSHKGSMSFFYSCTRQNFLFRN